MISSTNINIYSTLDALWKSVSPYLSHAITIVLTAGTTYFFTARHFRKEKRHEFILKRLEEFYGPLVGLIKQVRANAKVRLEVSRASDKAWHELCERHPQPFLESEKYIEPFKRGIEYENERFRKDDLSAYDKMLELLRTKNHLAYPSTLKWFDQFAQYVDQWHRPMPAEVIMQLGISEEPLLEFYADIERHCRNLQRKISGEKEANQASEATR